MRRNAVFGAAGLLAVPSLARAQAVRPAGKIGYLHPRTIAPDHPTLLALRAVWQRLGYVEGETVLLRSADGDSRRLTQLVEELVAAQPSVLIVVGAEAVRAAHRTTRSVPIVAIDLETDPVRAGYAASLARPGGNITGLFVDQPSLAGKWIELLREAAPGIDRLGLLWEPGTGREQLAVAQAVARAKGLAAVVVEMGPDTNFDDALRKLGNASSGHSFGIVHLTSPGFFTVAARFAAAARKYRIPSISYLKTYAQAGVLMTYGIFQEQYFARAMLIADKIVRGAKAGELPIEGPDRFELTLNRRTATALGLTLPQTLLLRADEVIE